MTDKEPNKSLGQIDDYQLQSELGRGGMGVVYKAVHLKSGTQVAIKLLLNPNHELKIKSLIEEAVTGKKVDHPNCLKIYEVLNYGDSESPAIISEYVEGLNARDFLDLPVFIDQEFVFSPLSASLIFEQMLRGLRAAHNAGLIHQDIKPENFLIEQSAIDAIKNCVNADGDLDHDEMDEVLLGLREESWIKLSDWGLSIYKARERSMEKSLSISLSRIPEEKRGGTLVYMPPEQIDGVGVSRRTDIFALGLVFYELLTGQAAIQARSSAEGLSADALDSAQNFLIQMVTSSAPSAVDGARDKALKGFRHIPQIPAMLESMTMRQKTDRIGSKDLSDELDDLLGDLLDPPRPFPKAFLFGACVVFLLPFAIWHVIFRLLPQDPKVEALPKKTPVIERSISVSEQQDLFIKKGLAGDQEALGRVVGLSLTQCMQLGESSFPRLNLASLKTLPADEAAALARFKGDELVLTGLNSLDPESAAKLRYFFGKKLALATELPLTEASMRELRNFSGEVLDLSGQQGFETGAVARVGQFSGQLLLQEAFQEAAAVAREAELAELPSGERTIISKLKAGSLGSNELQSLKSMSAFLARQIVDKLAQPDRRQAFLDLKILTPECAGILSRFKGKELLLTGLKTLSAEAARALSGFQGSILSVQSVEDLPPSVMAEFIPYSGELLCFNGTGTLTIQQARAMSQFKAKELRIFVLSSSETGSLRELAKFKGKKLAFTPPLTPSLEQLRELAQFRGDSLLISCFGRLNRPFVQALTLFQCKNLALLHPSGLTPALATLLSRWRGEQLAFINMENLSTKSAKELIRFKGSTLVFSGFPMSSSTKKILRSFPGTVKF